jgi:tetratricopeptide (TPR) repeat protein
MRTGPRVSWLAILFTAIACAQNGEWTNIVERAQRMSQSGRFLEALALFRQAAPLADSFGPRDTRSWVTYNFLGMAYQEGGLPAEAVRCFRHEMEMIKSTVGSGNASYVTAMTNLGTVYAASGEPASGENLLRKALHIETRLAAPDPLAVATIETRLSEALLNRGHYQEADRLLESAVPVVKASGEAVNTAIALNNLGVVRQRQHRYNEALELFSQALALLEQKYGPEHPVVLGPMSNIAVLYGETGRVAEGDALFRRAQAICERSMPPNHPSHANLLAGYAAFLRRAGDKSRAKAIEEQARSLARENNRRNGLGLTVDAAAFANQ